MCWPLGEYSEIWFKPALFLVELATAGKTFDQPEE
jgi:hypothetical protein